MDPASFSALDQAIADIDAASAYTDLFSLADVPAANRRFTALARLCHPDTVDPKDVVNRARATAAMSKLTRLHSEFISALRGTGDAPTTPTLLGKWLVSRDLTRARRGALNDLYVVGNTSDPAIISDGELVGMLKIARHPRDNKYLAHEAEILAQLHDSVIGTDIPFARYLPKLLDKFEASYRRVNVLSMDSQTYTLEHIRKAIAGAGGAGTASAAGTVGGIDFRHIVWMVNRALSLLGFIHREGVAHGAVLPHHLLYRPADHGLVLIDWACACRYGDITAHTGGSASEERIPYIVKRWREFYPLEVLYRKGVCTPMTDLYMLFATMRWAVGGMSNVPSRFRPLFELCLVESPMSRPFDAWTVQDMWKKLAEEEYGPAKFVKLEMSVN